MTTLQDDLPHPVPDYAHLRYKENYFFIILAEAQGVFGAIHLNHEPGFDRARYTCNLSIRGRRIDYHNQTAFPERFALERRIGDGVLELAFAEAHKRFELSLDAPEVGLALTFTARQPTFDYAACRTAGNPAPSFQQINTLGLNLPYNHQQQSLNVTGQVTVDGEVIEIAGSGYRDHSWVMRADSTIAQHSWCGFNFETLAIGAKANAAVLQPELFAKEGYVSDAKGQRAFRSIEVRGEGEGPDGLPAVLIHELEDVFGERFTIEADIAGRFAHVPLVSEAADGSRRYEVIENFCPVRLRETGERGVALVEMGRNSSLGPRTGPFRA